MLVSMVIVVFGPAGAGKSTVGRALAERLGWCFVEGDSFHSPESIARMRGGEPLTEAERRPWLEALAREVAIRIADGRSAVLACSALKRSHRRALIPKDAAVDDVQFVYLRAAPELLERRLRQRGGHFFPPALLATQFAALEEPGADERAPVLTVDASLPVETLVDEIGDKLHLRSTART